MEVGGQCFEVAVEEACEARSGVFLVEFVIVLVSLQLFVRKDCSETLP